MGQIFTCFTNNNLCCKEKSYSTHEILDDKYVYSYNRHNYDDDYGTCDL